MLGISPLAYPTSSASFSVDYPPALLRCNMTASLCQPGSRPFFPGVDGGIPRSRSSLHQPAGSCSTSYLQCAPQCRRHRGGRLVAAAAPPALDEATSVQVADDAQQASKAVLAARARKQAEVDAEDDPVKFPSTWEHRAWVYGTITLLSATAASGASKVQDWQSGLGTVAALIFGYYLADFLTGVYHWGVDNYGDGSTPVLGEQIAAFQGHHREPWTITERQFCNNVHKVFKPALPFAGVCLTASLWLPGWLSVALAVSTGLTCMSQQFHAWAHMKASQLPSGVRGLQEAGVLVSRRAHGAHHTAPFEGNYCIVSGAWNPILDNSGFFRQLEHVVHDLTGVQPRCWLPSDDPLFKR